MHLPRANGYGTMPRTKNGPALAGYGAISMNKALAASLATLPEQLRQSLTWDRGKEMSAHAQFTVDTGVAVYFADPKSPGSAGRTRTPTGCCGSTSPRAPTCRAGAPTTSPPLPTP